LVKVGVGRIPNSSVNVAEALEATSLTGVLARKGWMIGTFVRMGCIGSAEGVFVLRGGWNGSTIGVFVRVGGGEDAPVIGLSPVFIGLMYEMSVFEEPNPGAASALTESNGGGSEVKLFFLLSTGRASPAARLGGREVLVYSEVKLFFLFKGGRMSSSGEGASTRPEVGTLTTGDVCARS
jgi:hypothetical protein